MKIGDVVKSTKFEMEGTIQDIGPCSDERCDKISLTLDPRAKGVLFYYHAENFVVIPTQPTGD